MIRRFIVALFLVFCGTSCFAAECPYTAASNTWYWTVTGTNPTTQKFSRSDGAFVTLPDSGYTAFLTAGCTAGIIPTAAQLYVALNTLTAQSQAYCTTLILTGSTLANPINACYAVQMSSGSQAITLPNVLLPNAPPVGAQYIFQNSGSNAFDVKTNAAATIATVQPDTTLLLTLLSNATAAGTWMTNSIVYGDLAAGIATWLKTPTSANLAAAITNETGSGALVFATSPTLVTPNLGTPSSVNLVNGSNYPVSNLFGLGTGVATAIAINIGTAGSFVTNGGALGTPSSGTLTNATGLPTTGLTGTLQAAQFPALTGDVTTSAGALATTLATVATAGTTGSSTAIPVITINVKGLTTSITTAAVIAPAGTLTGATLASGVTASSLTSLGTITTLTATTINAFTLGGTIAGGGNQLNNIIIGTSTPLAGSFTTLSGSTSTTSPLIIGGSGTTGTQLTIKSTTGNGTTDTIVFTGGNNGATTLLTLSISTTALATFGGGIRPGAGTFAASTGQIYVVDTLGLILTAYGSSSGNDFTLTGRAGTTVMSIAANTNDVYFGQVATDAGQTDNTVCIGATGKLYKGSGTIGICLGTSSERYKNNVKPLKGGLSDILALKPVNFFYNKGYGDGGAREQFGFLAEDVAKSLPKLAGLDTNKRPNSVDILGMVPIIVQAIKDLKADNDNLRQELNALKKGAR